MKTSYKIVLLVLATLISFCILPAQEKENPIPAVTGFRGDFLKQLAEVEQKVVDLAGAMPAEKYSWRPMEGVRTVSEVYMHIAGSNYLLPSFAGIKQPEGLDRDMEKPLPKRQK